MDRFDEVLRELNQEMVETRNLTIKTDNSVRQLAGEVRSIARAQESRNRRTFFNSAVAYVLFAVLSFAGLFMFFRASMSESQVENQLSDEAGRTLQQRVESLESNLDQRRDAERAAWEFYELLASGAREELVERFPTIQGTLLDRATIELFRREVDRIREELANEAFTEGGQAFERERWQEAQEALLRSVAYKEFTPYTPQLHYRLAESYYQLGDYTSAARYFSLAIDSGQLGESQEIVAYYHRGEALRQMGRSREAVASYRTFVRKFPNHPWRSAAETRISNLNQ